MKQRCVNLDECRKHFTNRGRDKTISSSVCIRERFMCTVCERRWYDKYIYEHTIDISFDGDRNDEAYNTVISESRTIEND